MRLVCAIRRVCSKLIRIFFVGRDEVPAKQGIEGTVNVVMDERIMPSIRRQQQFGLQGSFVEKHQWINGGLEAR